MVLAGAGRRGLGSGVGPLKVAWVWVWNEPCARPGSHAFPSTGGHVPLPLGGRGSGPWHPRGMVWSACARFPVGPMQGLVDALIARLFRSEQGETRAAYTDDFGWAAESPPPKIIFK